MNKQVLKNSIIMLLFILLGCTSPKDNLNVTYLANCGFLYENQSSKIIIDAFGTEFGNFFFLPSTETKTNIELGNAPFNDIDLVLVTHIHGDHFNPFVAEKFLLNNKHAKLICPPQVYKQMKDSCISLNQIESQIISPELSMNELKTMNVNRIAVTAIRMQHGTNRSLQDVDYDDYTDYEKTENNGYLIDLDKKVVFHQGDACLKINEPALNKINRKIDIGYLSFFDWDTTSYNLLKEKLQAENIIFMHGTKPAKELQSEEIRSLESKLIFFKQESESKLFE